jgi:hypothetical protein
MTHMLSMVQTQLVNIILLEPNMHTSIFFNFVGEETDSQRC